ncbi:hypothetical protein [Halomonas sp. KO116]|uniref:hypothetical protein n=1 Tax=Halomonas sp. KO116 TaxID=1504981 RepID=UPI0004E33FE6|nr:hypothetical protein [Halomonas sp. KO116]AJY53216.1 hypothetical protein KO116_P200109 [Halomonas sp. KO116]
MYVNTDECEAAGVDPNEVKKIAAGLSRYAKQAERLGLTVFGGSGTGMLRTDSGKQGALILAVLDGDFDGGDGGTDVDQNGLQRG